MSVWLGDVESIINVKGADWLSSHLDLLWSSLLFSLRVSLAYFLFFPPSLFLHPLLLLPALSSTLGANQKTRAHKVRLVFLSFVSLSSGVRKERSIKQRVLDAVRSRSLFCTGGVWTSFCPPLPRRRLSVGSRASEREQWTRLGVVGIFPVSGSARRFAVWFRFLIPVP